VAADVDLLGRDRRFVCGSCWRIVEGWLQAPPPPDGEDLVVAWLVATVLAGGSAMIEEVPFGRVGPLRARARKAIKAAIGGSVTTSLISSTAIMVWSSLVIDAKTDGQHHREMRDAVQRVAAIGDNVPVGEADWRRSWSEVIAAGTR